MIRKCWKPLYRDFGFSKRFEFVVKKNFQISKAKFAEAAGAIGLILYTDPKDYSPVDPSDTYPNSWWMPPTGVQRGTLFLQKGDPLTPGYPSKGKTSINLHRDL